MIYEYIGEVVRIIDGDTLVLKLTKEFSQQVDFGFHIKDTMTLTKSTEITFRLSGIDTAELKGGTSESKQLAQDAKFKVIELTENKKLKVITEKPDKYGRWLATIFIDNETISLNDTLINLGLAVPYLKS
jgi:micrococcal nuclease